VKMLCPKCGAQNSADSQRCRRCESKLFHSKLEVVTKDGAKRPYFLLPRNYKIGRDLANDILIPDTSVSRFHAELRYRNGAFSLWDNDSKNGSYVNHYHIRRQRVFDGDRIQLGHVTLLYHCAAQRRLQKNALSTEEFVQKEFFKLAENRSSKLTTHDVLSTLLDLLVWLLHAQKIILFQADNRAKLTFKIGRQADGESFSQPQLADAEWLLLNKVIRTREITTNKGTYSPGTRAETPGHWSQMALPLQPSRRSLTLYDELRHHGLLGICYIIRDAKAKRLSEKRFNLLQTIVQQLSQAIENDILYEEVSEKKKMRHQLSLAQDIQQHLFPTDRQHTEHLEIAYLNRPCETVSGDYFDIIPIDTDKTAIAIGDICGKGIPAALLSSTVRAAIRAQLAYSTSPVEIIHNLNKLFIHSTAESIFFTLFFSIFDHKAGRLAYINAGHPPPIVLADDLQELSATTVALGILDDEIEGEKTIAFGPGDMVIMYTDGIIETQNPAKAIYGRKRLLDFVRSNLGKIRETAGAPEAILHSITADLDRFSEHSRQSDDLTLMAVRHR